MAEVCLNLFYMEFLQKLLKFRETTLFAAKNETSRVLEGIVFFFFQKMIEQGENWKVSFEEELETFEQ